MTRGVSGVLLTWLVLLAALVGGPSRAAAVEVSPPPVAPATAAPTATATAPAQVEVPDVEGAANPLQAPPLPLGQATDTILQTEVLWYALPALPGQRVTVAVTVLGRPDGPVSDTTVVEATIRDAQRLPVEQAMTSFDGRVDASAAPAGAEVPPIGADAGSGALLSVALQSSTGAADLAGVGYRLVLQVEVDGTPTPIPAATTDSQDPTGPAAPEASLVPSADAPEEPASADLVGDLLPVALVALAIGGVGGFELSRRGL